MSGVTVRWSRRPTAPRTPPWKPTVRRRKKLSLQSRGRRPQLKTRNVRPAARRRPATTRCRRGHPGRLSRRPRGAGPAQTQGSSRVERERSQLNRRARFAVPFEQDLGRAARADRMPAPGDDVGGCRRRSRRPAPPAPPAHEVRNCTRRKFEPHRGRSALNARHRNNAAPAALAGTPTAYAGAGFGRRPPSVTPPRAAGPAPVSSVHQRHPRLVSV